LAEPAIHQVVVVPAPPELVLQQLLSVSGADKYQPLMHSPQGLTLQRKKIPVWAIVVAIFFFPLGLIALFAKEESTVGIGLAPVQGGTQVTISGQASNVLQSALQYVLAGNAATPAGLPENVYTVSAQPPRQYPPQPQPQQPGWSPPPPPPPPPPPVV
jgi:hypothetical protein